MGRFEKTRQYVYLHILLLFYSLGSVCSKLAGQFKFLSIQFFLLYGFVLLILTSYAVFWQQILKRIPLVTAYANKSITVVWGIVWGLLFFNEHITINHIAGAAIIIAGIYMVVKADE